MRLSFLSAALAPWLILLPSCVGAPEQPSVPTPTPGPATVARPASAPQSAPIEWQYRSATPGNWRYSADNAGSAAIFFSPAGHPLLTFRCDNMVRRISVARVGVGQNVMILRTSYGAISWPVSSTSSEVVATRAANDPALDQIAYSRGRFTVEMAGLETLILPAWAEVGRVVEDCRA